MKAIGAGTVELPVVTNKGFAIITFRNVLHAPTATCNIFGRPAEIAPHSASIGDGIYLEQEKQQWAILDNPKLSRLRLVGQSQTQTSLDRNAHYWIGAIISQSERERLEKEVAEADARLKSQYK
ncbi:hypothetical protein ABW20_dc0106718 [Dactylellina cionopaga]|nr:hypothetical protein ABW20_dc0106718 [Dactylellina cionopaga]